MPKAKKIGLIAGKGEFPKLLARAAGDQGYQVEIFAIRKITEPTLADESVTMHWLHLGEFGKLIDICHEQGIQKLAMAGNVPHTAIFRYRGFDTRSLKILGRAANWKTDSILGAVAAELAKEHIEVIDSTIFLRSLMPKRGLLTPRRELTKAERQDILFGFPIAKEMGRMDIGQAIAVKDRSVVAVESLEGTDRMIERAGELAGAGIVICKTSKPQQDSRFDVPVVGVQTIRTLAKIEGAVLAIEANSTLFFNQEEAVEMAQEKKIAIFASSSGSRGWVD